VVAESRGEGLSTEPEELSTGRLVRARFGRRVFFVLLCLLVGAALAGSLGVRTAEATGSGGGYEVSVTYPSIIRPGLATHVTIELQRAGGFPGVVTVAGTSSYFDIFDENGLDPDPVSATTDEERTIWTFVPPEGGDTMTVSFDVRIEPGVQLKRAEATVSVLEGGQPAVNVNFRTLVLP
jgi:uncharacterized protein (DUF58 family)